MATVCAGRGQEMGGRGVLLPYQHDGANGARARRAASLPTWVAGWVSG